MKPRNIVIMIAIMAGGVGLTAMVERPVVAAIPQAAPAEFDFTALHRQASDALDNLRRAQQNRASTTTAAN